MVTNTVEVDAADVDRQVNWLIVPEFEIWSAMDTRHEVRKGQDEVPLPTFLFFSVVQCSPVETCVA